MTLMSNVGCMVEAYATIIVCYLWSDVILISPPPPYEMNLMLCQCRAWDPPTAL